MKLTSAAKKDMKQRAQATPSLRLVRFPDD